MTDRRRRAASPRHSADQRSDRAALGGVRAAAAALLPRSCVTSTPRSATFATRSSSNEEIVAIIGAEQQRVPHPVIPCPAQVTAIPSAPLDPSKAGSPCAMAIR